VWLVLKKAMVRASKVTAEGSAHLRAFKGALHCTRAGTGLADGFNWSGLGFYPLQSSAIYNPLSTFI
jgi:hypothetical protein